MRKRSTIAVSIGSSPFATQADKSVEERSLATSNSLRPR
jgi:hypothetical protein